MNRLVVISGVAIAASLTAVMFARASDDTPLKFQCMVKDAQILPDRTHVRCANRGLNGLSEFAAETNQPFANQVAAAVVQSLRTGARLVITYAPSDELNPDGCNRRVCRKILGVGGSGNAVRPPVFAPMPASASQPSVAPDDFDPVDASVDEASFEEPRIDAPSAPRIGVAATPAPAVKLAPQPFEMRPIED